MDKTSYIQKNIGKWMSFLLSSGENGHKQPIVTITDLNGKTPSKDNNFLLNAEGTEFKGRFKNSSNQLFDFSLTKKGETWTREFMPAKNVQNGVK